MGQNREWDFLCLRPEELVPPWSQGLSNVLEVGEAWKMTETARAVASGQAWLLGMMGVALTARAVPF